MHPTSAYPDICKKLKVVLLLPTYNNLVTLPKVILDCEQYCQDIIIINDGSSDGTYDWLEDQGKQYIVHHFEKNQGKGRALKKGFELANKLGFKYALTIDTDGQHFAQDLPHFIDTIHQKPGSFVVGVRDFDRADMPGKNSFGNKFSNFWFEIETGQKLADTQSGFRAYPLQEVVKLKTVGSKYELETELLVRLAWRSIPILPVPIKVQYNQQDYVSHFRPFRDFSRISVLHTVLFTLAILYYRPLLAVRAFRKDGILVTLKKLLWEKDKSHHVMASAVGFGFFMGIVPIWGFQLAVGIPLAVIFRLPKALFIAAANISIPPFLPFILGASFLVGGFFIPQPQYFPTLSELTLQSIQSNITQYLIGSVVLAVSAGIIGYFTMRLVLLVCSRNATK